MLIQPCGGNLLSEPFIWKVACADGHWYGIPELWNNIQVQRGNGITTCSRRNGIRINSSEGIIVAKPNIRQIAFTYNRIICARQHGFNLQHQGSDGVAAGSNRRYGVGECAVASKFIPVPGVWQFILANNKFFIMGWQGFSPEHQRPDGIAACINRSNGVGKGAVAAESVSMPYIGQFIYTDNQFHGVFLQRLDDQVQGNNGIASCNRRNGIGIGARQVNGVAVPVKRESSFTHHHIFGSGKQWIHGYRNGIICCTSLFIGNSVNDLICPCSCACKQGLSQGGIIQPDGAVTTPCMGIIAGAARNSGYKLH